MLRIMGLNTVLYTNLDLDLELDLDDLELELDDLEEDLEECDLDLDLDGEYLLRGLEYDLDLDLLLRNLPRLSLELLSLDLRSRE